jgi:translation initiation factor IF-3
LNLRVNHEIRARSVRVIGHDGQQVGVISFREAMTMAHDLGLDLVEVVPTAEPPVCKILDFGKFRYDQSKKEKENKKAQHQIKVKEIKVKPNIDDNDLETKIRHARSFLEEGNKVRVTCTFRGREMAHPELGHEVVKRVCTALEEVAKVDADNPAKQMGRILSLVLVPALKKKKVTTV